MSLVGGAGAATTSSYAPPVRLVSLLAPALALLSACEQLTPLENYSCGDDDTIALDSRLDGLRGVVEVAEAFVANGDAVIELLNTEQGGLPDATLRFPFVSGRAVALPAAGTTLQTRASSASCTGEGCDIAIFTLDGVVSVGRLNSIDDVDSSGQHDRMSLVAVDDDDVCADGQRAPVAMSLRHDGGSTTHLPGESVDVVIDGAAHTLLVGAASYREFDGPAAGENCSDCPSPGRHFDVGVDVVLYRAAD